jgi:lysophospholipase L1-like esterase
MKMNHRSVLLLATGSVALALSACSNGNSSNPQAIRTAAQAANAGNFTSVYFLGDSLTAGFQSDSLIDTSQPNGWANLVAKQIGTPIELPLIAPPGAPNQITLVHLSPLTLGTLAGTTTGRDDFTIQPTDVAVPGALTNDVLNTLPLLTPTTGQQQLNQLVLGYPGFGYGVARSQAQQAAAANPTTIFLWIGNNDALVADETGMPSSMTPLATFTTQYQQLINYLEENTNAHLIIANIPDVTAVPYLTPAAYVLAETSAQTGVPVANLSAILGITTGDLVNPTGTAEIPLILAGQQAGPISDSGFLSAAEVVTVQTMVTAYNGVIASNAKAAGATLVDINALFAQTSANGITENGITGTTAFLGGAFSLDGIHPTNTGYAVLANKFIDTINSSLSKTYADVNVAAIAAVDPLFPPYPGHHAVKRLDQGAAPMTMPQLPASARQSLHEIFGPRE